MSLHAELLKQAKHLAMRESRRPRQASLCRAVSSAYYAIFHLLTFEASRRFVKDRHLLARINRTYNHAEMRKVSREFMIGHCPRAIGAKGSLAMPPTLMNVAKTFVDLQEARHEADYNLSKSFTRQEALAIVRRVEQAFVDWSGIRQDDFARTYLGCFLLWDKWDKER